MAKSFVGKHVDNITIRIIYIFRVKLCFLVPKFLLLEPFVMGEFTSADVIVFLFPKTGSIHFSKVPNDNLLWYLGGIPIINSLPDF